MDRFQQEVIDRLARIEVLVETNGTKLDQHTREDDRRFHEVEADLRLLLIADKARKETATRQAKSSGRWWGAVAASLVAGLAEVMRHVFLMK